MKWPVIAYVLILSALPMQAQADDPPRPIPPVAIIRADPPGVVAPGTLVKLDGTASTGDTLLWDSDVPATLYHQDTNGRLIYFAAVEPGTYLFRLDSFALTGGKIAAGRAKVAVTVRGAAPIPDSKPPPSTDPDPADRFGLIAATRAIAARQTWNADQKGVIRDRIVPVYLAGPHSFATAMPEALGTTTESAVYVSWKKVLFTPIRTEIDKRVAAGQLTAATLPDAFVDVAAALTLEANR